MATTRMMLLAAALLAAVAAATVQAQTAGWQQLPTDGSTVPFTARADTAIWYQAGKVFMAGGSIPELWSSPDGGNTWELMRQGDPDSTTDPYPMPLATGGAGVAVLSDGKVVVVGGRYQGPSRAQASSSVDNGVTWMPLPDAPFERAHFPLLVLPGDVLLALGGMSTDGSKHNDIWRSTDAGLTWEQRPTAPWAPRAFHGAVVLADGSIVVAGGGLAWTSTYNDVWRSTDGGDTWQQAATAPWTGRTALLLRVADYEVLLLGGDKGSGVRTNEVWHGIMDPATGEWTWQQMANADWSARTPSGLVLPGGNVLLVGAATTEVWRTACPAGAAGGAISCADCPVNKFSAVAGLAHCTDCAANHYTAVTGSTSCTMCPTTGDAPTGCPECDTVLPNLLRYKNENTGVDILLSTKPMTAGQAAIDSLAVIGYDYEVPLYSVGDMGANMHSADAFCPVPDDSD